MEEFFEVNMQLLVKMLTVFSASIALGAAFPASAAWENVTTPTLQMAESAPGVTASVRAPFYQITSNDVTAAVVEQLQTQGVEVKAEAMMAPGTPSVLYTSDHAIKVAVHALQVDPKSKRWQGQAYFLSGDKTESVRPIAGTYATLVDVPVVTRQLSRNDVIEEKDITIKAMPERLLRKDTILDAKQLVGQSPKNGISPQRPIHAMEVSAPIVVKKGDLVEMAYDTPYIHIKTTGVALEDGAQGAPIRVKNQKSQLAVSAKVSGAGKVAVGTEAAL